MLFLESKLANKKQQVSPTGGGGGMRCGAMLKTSINLDDSLHLTSRSNSLTGNSGSSFDNDFKKSSAEFSGMCFFEHVT